MLLGTYQAGYYELVDSSAWHAADAGHLTNGFAMQGRSCIQDDTDVTKPEVLG